MQFDAIDELDHKKDNDRFQYELRCSTKDSNLGKARNKNKDVEHSLSGIGNRK
jgi:hypothetical protein